jgi:hypothetical protein
MLLSFFSLSRALVRVLVGLVVWRACKRCQIVLVLWGSHRINSLVVDGRIDVAMRRR